jgi:hypothetical protein
MGHIGATPLATLAVLSSLQSLDLSNHEITGWHLLLRCRRCNCWSCATVSNHKHWGGLSGFAVIVAIAGLEILCPDHRHRVASLAHLWTLQIKR